MTIISANHKMVFIHIPKCGGTSVEQEFQKYVKWGDFVIGGTPDNNRVSNIYQSLYGIHKHNPAIKLKSLLTSRELEYTYFTLIREPKKIVESKYKWVYRLAEEHSRRSSDTIEKIRDDIRRKRNGDVLKGPQSLVHMVAPIYHDALLAESFSDFVFSILGTRWQGNYLSRNIDDESGNQIVPHVFKLEQIQELEQFLQQRMGRPSFKIPHVNKGKAVPIDWAAEALNRFYQINEAEYSRFGYEIKY